MSKEAPVMTRKAIESDVAFIFNSWLKSFRQSNLCKGITDTIYYNEHHKVIENLLLTCDTFILCPESNPDDIYGYICAEKIDGVFVVHFIYIKHIYRGLGLAKKLVEVFEHDYNSAGMYTHDTRIGETLAKKYNFVYNPYVALIKNYRK